ncbi:hypothetical protein FI667_g12582, partial [Globisporangium splendens]
MEDDAYEAAVASEGDNASFSADRDGLLRDFLERFALAVDASSKRAAVGSALLAGSSEALYYSGLCDLHEIQTLLNENTQESDVLAWERFEDKKRTLESTVGDLQARYCHKKAARLQQRLLLLQMELQKRLNKPKDDFQNSMLSTKLNNALIDTEQIITSKLSYLKVYTSDDDLLRAARGALDGLGIYARELWFHRLYFSELGSDWKPTAEQRWSLLELFLDRYYFDYVDVKGYLDLILEDLKRESKTFTNRPFSYRNAHQKLSFAHLEKLHQKAPDLFRDSVQFATRAIQLQQATAEQEKAEAINFRDEAKRQCELQNLSKYLEYLSDFSAAVNSLRLTLLHQKLRLLHLQHMETPSEPELLMTLLEYIKIPRLGASYMKPKVSAGIPAEHVVALGSANSLGYDTLTSDADRQVICDVLEVLWSSDNAPESIDNSLAEYLTDNFLRPEKALCKIKAGKGDVLEWTKQLSGVGNSLADLSSTSELTFCASNPSHFGANDDLTIFIRVRNVKLVTVHLYEICTIDYYSRIRKEIQGDINLDGLLPNDEQRIDLSHLTPFHESRIPVTFPQAKSKRGVFVVEVLEGGQTCRAILRKGFLRHVERITIEGHELLVLDERGEMVRDARALVLNLKSGNSKAQPGRYYNADGSGKILIPFRHRSAANDQYAIVFCHNDFGFFQRSFVYLTEKLELCADMHIDYEQLVPGAKAQLVARPYLLVGDVRQEVSFDTLTQVTMAVKFAKAGSETGGSEEVQAFSGMQHFIESDCSFEIPMDTDSFTVTLSARASKPDQSGSSVGGGKYAPPLLSCTKPFQVTRVMKSAGIASLHLTRRPTPSSNAPEYILMVLGHNGESVPNAEVEVVCEHVYFVNEIATKLQSSLSGEIHLGQLIGVQRISATLPKQRELGEWDWKLPNFRFCQPQNMYCSVGEVIEIPIAPVFRDQMLAWHSQDLVSLCRVIKPARYEPVLEQVSSTIDVVKNKDGVPVLFSIVAPTSGQYAFYVRPLALKFPITVVGKKNSALPIQGDVLILKQQLLLSSPCRPLTILSQEIKREGESKQPVLEIQLKNFSEESTHVIVTFRQFLDAEGKSIDQVVSGNGLQSTSKSGFRLPDLMLDVSLLENEFLKKRKISDEYKYILERRLLAQSNPSSLLYLGSPIVPKPSLLQNPHEVNSTDMEEVVMGKGEKVRGMKDAKRVGLCKGGAARHRILSSDDPTVGLPSVSFLAQRSQILMSKLPADGLVRVDLKELDFFSDKLDTSEGSFEVVVLAIDYDRRQVCSNESAMTLATDPHKMAAIHKRDVRLSEDEALDHTKHYSQKQLHEVVLAGETRVLPRSSSTKYALYESIDDALDLWNTLCNDADLRELTERLREWPTMNLQSKHKFYYANLSDDLNVFLYRKDNSFFEQFIKPLVGAKISKSLIDHYLLGDEAAIRKLYLAPGVFQELSVVEKLLIVERISSVRDVKRICERVCLDIETATDPNKLVGLFESVLSQGAVKPSERPEESLVDYECDEESFKPFESCPGGSGFAFGGAPIVSTTCAAMPKSFSRKRMEMQILSRSSAGIEIGNTEDSDDDFGVVSISSDEGDSEDDGDGMNTDKEDELKQKAAKKKREVPYIPPGKVRMLQEKRFYAKQRPHLDGRNNFWKAYAEHILHVKTSHSSSDNARFLSAYFPEALLSLNEGLLALAVLDLPIIPTASTEVRIVSPAGTQVELCPTRDVILYHQNIEPGECAEDPNSNLILKQKIVRYNESRGYASRASEARAVLELVIGSIYTCVVDASNVGSSQLSSVNLLMQIPEGAIPLFESSFFTKNHVIDIPPNHTATHTVDFYFPEAGTFSHYPAHASLGGKIVAWTATRASLEVLQKPTRVDLTSWSDVSARGSLDDVLSYLSSQKKVLSIDLSPLGWRCQGDESFYRGLTGFLREKMIFNESVWKYALRYGDVVGTQELLASSTHLMQSVGMGIDTSFVSAMELYHYERYIKALSNGFDHSEFGPFLHRRVHKITAGTVASSASSGKGARILNKKARDFYTALCQRLGHFATLDGQPLLVLTYFMLLFHRMEDAVSVFARLQALPASKRSAVEGTVQYDYVDSYLDLFRDHRDGNTFAVARRNVRKYEKHPYARWRERFVCLGDYIAEFDQFEEKKKLQAAEDSTRADVPVSDTLESAPVTTTLQVKLDAIISGNEVHLTSQLVSKCDISFYPIDIEFMFSTEPFDTFSDSASSTSSSLLLIQPRSFITVDLEPAQSENSVSKTVVQIPDALADQQMMIRIREQTETREIETVAAPIDLTRSYFNSTLHVEVMKQSGILQVFHKGLPVSKCYVKVYAKVSSSSMGATLGVRSSSGKSQFYKDGYTDVLGKFDYAGVNGDLIERVEKFSILTSHAKFGTSVQQADPPVLATTLGDFQHQEMHDTLLY